MNGKRNNLRNNFIILLIILCVSAFYNLYLIIGTIDGFIEYDGSYTPVHTIIWIATLIYVYKLTHVLYKKWYVALTLAVMTAGLMKGWFGIALCIYFIVVAHKKIKNENKPLLQAQQDTKTKKEFQINYCSECRHKLEKDSKFCPQCGIKI